MRYWPLSEICMSPLMHHVHQWELMCAYVEPRMSQGTMIACNQVTAQTPARETPMVIIESVNAPNRRVYTSYPEFEDWLRLERAGFVAADGMLYFVIDGLH